VSVNVFAVALGATATKPVLWPPFIATQGAANEDCVTVLHSHQHAGRCGGRQTYKFLFVKIKDTVSPTSATMLGGW
jgi:hypothetical protein